MPSTVWNDGGRLQPKNGLKKINIELYYCNRWRKYTKPYIASCTYSVYNCPLSLFLPPDLSVLGDPAHKTKSSV
jgi:hypothetical protein